MTHDEPAEDAGRSRHALRPSGGQVLLAALIGLYFLVLYSQNWYWPRFGVPSVPDLSFVDIRYWTTAWECARDGIDVVPRNLCDPHGMRLNDHPRIWLAPAFLGLGESSTFVLGLLVAAAFLVAVFATIGRIGVREAFLYAALLCSPSVMLGIERANTDLIVFVVVAAGVLVVGRGTKVGAAIGSALLLFAAVLKLYPALAWGALLRLPRRRAIASLLVMSAAFAVYVLATLDDLRAMREHFPRELQFSYGAPVLADGLGSGGLGGHLLVVAAGLALAAGLFALAKRRPSADLDLGTETALFLAGAGIYVGSYAFTFNFNYRLIFLLLTVPYLLRSTRRSGVVLILLALWLGSTLPYFPFRLGEDWADASDRFPWDELVNWLLFAYLAAAYVLVVSVSRRGAAESRAR